MPDRDICLSQSERIYKMNLINKIINKAKTGTKKIIHLFGIKFSYKKKGGQNTSPFKINIEELKKNIEACKLYVQNEGLLESNWANTPNKPKKLAVIGGYPLAAYIHLGYDNLAPYYNPMLLFDEVYYFQTTPVEIEEIDFGYKMFVVQFSNSDDIYRICKEKNVDIIRAYDYANSNFAYKVAKKLNIPLVTSIH